MAAGGAACASGGRRDQAPARPCRRACARLPLSVVAASLHRERCLRCAIHASAPVSCVAALRVSACLLPRHARQPACRRAHAPQGAATQRNAARCHALAAVRCCARRGCALCCRRLVARPVPGGGNGHAGHRHHNRRRACWCACPTCDVSAIPLRLDRRRALTAPHVRLHSTARPHPGRPVR